jgi:hypothetical protein
MQARHSATLSLAACNCLLTVYSQCDPGGTMTLTERTRGNPAGKRGTPGRERDGRVGNNVSIHGLLFPVTAPRESGRFHPGSRTYPGAALMGYTDDLSAEDSATRFTSSSRGTSIDTAPGSAAGRRSPGAAGARGR